MPQEKTNSNNSEKPKNAYFLSLELENVRCFGEKQNIDFSDGNDIPRQWTIILGDNGTGKTTILQNLIAMLPTIDRHGNMLVTVPNIPIAFLDIRTFEEGPLSKYYLGARYSLQSNLKDIGSQISLTAEKQKENAIPLHKVLWQVITINCLAYGASRKAGKTSLSEQEENSFYKTLFDETALLINPEEWLLFTDYASRRPSKFAEKRKHKLKQIRNVLIKILPDVADIKFTEKESSRLSARTGNTITLRPKLIVEFQTPYGWVEAKDLSLGYRTSMAWMVDFASRMFDLYPESENPLAEPAVVLIDEIDLHLHPKWQRDLLPWLSELFPNTQFIVTTHSPLIVQSAVARDANIVVCRREGDHVVIDQSIEAVKNWRADQILTSDFFGLETARPKEIEKDLLERKEILSKAKLTKKDEKRLKMLESEIGFMPVGENPEDDKAMDIIMRAAERLQSEAK